MSAPFQYRIQTEALNSISSLANHSISSYFHIENFRRTTQVKSSFGFQFVHITFRNVKSEERGGKLILNENNVSVEIDLRDSSLQGRFSDG